MFYQKRLVVYLMAFFPLMVISGRNIQMPRIDMANPPIVPAANGNQKASFSVPAINGTKPSIVETTVRKMGMILAFHALRYACIGVRRGRSRRTRLYSFRI